MKAVWAERQLESALIFPPCRMMKAGLFTQSYLKAIFNERFTNAQSRQPAVDVTDAVLQ